MKTINAKQMRIDPLAIIRKYYIADSELYKILVIHSRSVADKALQIAAMHPEMDLDLDFIEESAMLHDIGVFLCDAPSIYCMGKEPYIRHGYLGAALLRNEGLERHARVAERHTGTGLTIEMIKKQELPLPIRDFSPETLEEQLVCFADKFYSKTNLTKEKTPQKICYTLSKYGPETVERFKYWYKLFLGD